MIREVATLIVVIALIIGGIYVVWFAPCDPQVQLCLDREKK